MTDDASDQCSSMPTVPPAPGMEEIGAGAPLAFDDLVAAYTPLVMQVCRHVTGNLADAEDAAQATFLALAQQHRSGRTVAVLTPWVRRVARNCATHVRDAAAARARHERQAGVDHLRHASLEEAPAGGDEATAATARLRVALARLPDVQRQALELHYLHGHPLTSIAVALEATPGTVAAWLSRARARLRQDLHLRESAVVALLALLRATSPATLPHLNQRIVPLPRRRARRLAVTTGTLAALLLIGAGVGAASLWRAGAAPVSGAGHAAVRHAAAFDPVAAPGLLQLADPGEAFLGCYTYLSEAHPAPPHLPALIVGGGELPPVARGDRQGLTYVSWDSDPQLRVWTNGAPLPALAAGSSVLVALPSPPLAPNERWMPYRLERTAERITIRVHDWVLGDAQAPPDRRYLYLATLGKLPAGAYALTVVVEQPATRCQRTATLALRIPGPGEGPLAAQVLSERAWRTQAVAPATTAPVMCSAMELADGMAPLPPGLAGAGVLVDAQALQRLEVHAGLPQLHGLPSFVSHPAPDAWITVVIAAPPGDACHLSLDQVRCTADGLEIDCDDWEDVPGAIRPRQALLVVQCERPAAGMPLRLCCHRWQATRSAGFARPLREVLPTNWRELLHLVPSAASPVPITF